MEFIVEKAMPAFILAALSAVVFTVAVDAVSTCSYTFNVPNDDREACAPSGTPCDTDSIQGLLSNEHTTIAAKLDAMTTMLRAVLNNSDSDGGRTDDFAMPGAGVNYVRWGRTTCPDTSVMLYEGYMGRSHFTHGGGTNYLCLPTNPDFRDGTTAGFQSNSFVYGVEYQGGGSPFLDASKLNDDAPCAVCEAQGRLQLLMIPAKLTCPTGWTMEYEGVLMSHHYTHNAGEFVCVADGMETVDGGSADVNGGMLWVVEAKCGSLPCPPYNSGYEIICVVCTK